eukprot:TRINITY_DN3177_c1_g1_i1.p1 TRINITY_DN3177_c1_g1~~TRINITY_DN3177_c1_g1_i1.p1  ORF type:complete len:494 (+),score=99.36 TRINITY_DN3177_c1_g1_i1:95-1576(+)
MPKLEIIAPNDFLLFVPPCNQDPVDKSRDVEDLDETETSRHMKSTHHIQQDASKDKQPRLRRLKIRSHHEMDDFLVFDNQDDEDEDEISELEDISSWEKPADVLPTNQDMEYLSGDDVHIDLTDTVEIPEGDVIDSRLESPISRRPDVKWRLRDSPAKIPQGTCFDVENSTRKSRLPLESPESGCGEDDDDYEEEKGANGSGDEYDVEALISDRRQRSNRRRLTEDDFLVQDDEIVYEDDSQLDSESISETQNQESPSKYESMCSQRHRLASIPMENTGFELLTFTSKQAFEIVIQYLASCLVSTDFYSSLQDDEDSKSYFFSALRKFHNEVSVRKDSLLSSQAWGHEYREDVKSLPVFSYSNTVSGDDCMACGRSNHPARYLVKLSGTPYDSDATWTLDWNPKKALKSDAKPGPPAVYEVGRFCRSRSYAFHQFQHYKIHLTLAVQEYLDGTIGEDADRIQQLISDEPWIEQKWNEHQTMVEYSESYKDREL